MRQYCLNYHHYLVHVEYNFDVIAVQTLVKLEFIVTVGSIFQQAQ